MSATERPAREAQAFAFPWDEALALGLGVLRWRPRDFWAATPRELLAACARPPVPAAGRADLDRLIAAFPDAYP